MFKQAMVVFRKELLDALRDTKTLMMVLVSSVLVGPVVLFALSMFVSGLEARAEKRNVVVQGAEFAPQLINYLERQTYTVSKAPDDYEAKLRAGQMTDPVVIIPADFQTKMANGEAPTIAVASDSTNKQAEAASTRITRLVSGYNQELMALHLAVRGASMSALTSFSVEGKDLANVQSRATQLTGMLPFFVILAVLYGALNAALDSTAGERERGSLEPLLINPAERSAFVMGKWAAVASLGMLIAVLSAMSFLPAQLILRSESLQSMFSYGWKEAFSFIVTLLPFAAALSAVLMAVAIRCKTFKEAQASSVFVIMAVSFMPLITLFSTNNEAKWQLLIPALGQNMVMMRVLKGESIGLLEIGLPIVSAIVLTSICLWYITDSLKRAKLLN
jgi:sodium transport system permease protein